MSDCDAYLRIEGQAGSAVVYCDKAGSRHRRHLWSDGRDVKVSWSDDAVGAGRGVLCQMCEDETATTTWGAPVCEYCSNMLDEVDGELQAMEAADPELKKLGDRIRRYSETLNSGDEQT